MARGIGQRMGHQNQTLLTAKPSILVREASSGRLQDSPEAFWQDA
jgi:hypothetical protein